MIVTSQPVLSVINTKSKSRGLSHSVHINRTPLLSRPLPSYGIAQDHAYFQLLHAQRDQQIEKQSKPPPPPPPPGARPQTNAVWSTNYHGAWQCGHVLLLLLLNHLNRQMLWNTCLHVLHLSFGIVRCDGWMTE